MFVVAVPITNLPSPYKCVPLPVMVLPLTAGELPTIISPEVSVPISAVIADNVPTFKLLMYGVDQAVVFAAGS